MFGSSASSETDSSSDKQIGECRGTVDVERSG